jgi:hypothetical protein
MPLLVSSDHAAASRLFDAGIAPDVARWARSVRTAWGDPERVRNLADLLRRDYPQATHVEDRLYEGGLFPLQCDAGLLAAFHTADPADKPALLPEAAPTTARILTDYRRYLEDA